MVDLRNAPDKIGTNLAILQDDVALRRRAHPEYALAVGLQVLEERAQLSTVSYHRCRESGEGLESAEAARALFVQHRGDDRCVAGRALLRLLGRNGEATSVDVVFGHVDDGEPDAIR